MNIAIIGGGAAGFFSAINAKENYPHSNIQIFEKSHKVLSKLRISGGGRCNVTNGCKTIEDLILGYPRGSKFLKKNFYIFNNKHTFDWFSTRGVPIYVQDDNRAFPTTNSSDTIINCFLEEVKRLKIKINLGVKVKSLKQTSDERLELAFDGADKSIIFNKVIVTTGGSPKMESLNWLKNLGHRIEPPVPSLFTFKISDKKLTQLMGLAVENCFVSIQGTNLKSEGPVLITHWGMSGPAILKLSAFGARILSDMNYLFKINVNWIHESNNDNVINHLKAIASSNPNKQLINLKPYTLPSRLWTYLIEKLNYSLDRTWGEIGNKGANKIANILINDEYQINGRTTYRDEFVTCGGVSLKSVDMNTMSSKVVKNLYFAGEVLDIDGITGGYNFQNAWTSAYIAAKLL